ncbi:MAG: DUF4097 family beta strand repeat-containing protein [Actinophytocola sp.]|uniref:DUF4097 family beta strand repeat-containing protein n=1 Tax=Actinophytocola sp. TaxID=1872138 RepID=UPI003D6ACBB3
MGIGRAVAAAAIGIIGLGTLAACDWVATESYSDSTSVGQPFTSVRFANDSGSITIRGGDEAKVQREVHYRDEKPSEDTYRVRDGVLQVDSCDRRDCWIDYEITVPEGTTVSGQLDSGAANVSGVAEVNMRSSSGKVEINDVEGEVNVEASSGSVSLSDIGGAVVAKAESGAVRADDVRGDLTLQASSGSVEARGIGGATHVESDSGKVVVELTVAEDVRVDADSGSVEVAVPDGSYQVTTSSDSGNVSSEIDNDAAGDHKLDLHTDSGSIDVTRT